MAFYVMSLPLKPNPAHYILYRCVWLWHSMEGHGEGLKLMT